jgi:hypothetical protein
MKWEEDDDDDDDDDDEEDEGEAVERDFKAKVLRASAAAKGGSKCRELTTTSPHDSVRAVQSIAKRACLHNGHRRRSAQPRPAVGSHASSCRIAGPRTRARTQANAAARQRQGTAPHRTAPKYGVTRVRLGGHPPPDADASQPASKPLAASASQRSTPAATSAVL